MESISICSTGRARWYRYYLNGRASGIGIVLQDRGVLGVTKYKLARRTKELFGIAIEKSNVEGDLMQIELPDSAIDFVRTQIRNRGKRRFVGCKSETGVTCSAYNLNISAFHTILG